jgi:predicted nuclease of predicted toxin-antitoxin system
MKLLIDMNLSPTWVRFLIEAGFEAIHWSEIDAGDAPDQDLLRWAADHQYVLLTNDLDFGAILAATQSRRPSVVQIRSDLLAPEAIGEAVLAAIRRAHQDILDGALLSIDPTRFRVRILPLDSPQGS